MKPINKKLEIFLVIFTITPMLFILSIICNFHVHNFVFILFEIDMLDKSSVSFDCNKRILELNEIYE